VKLLEAQRKLKALNQAVLLSSDVAALLNIQRSHASKVMSRLAESGFAIQLTRGRWVIADLIERLSIPEFLSAPSPSYISLQTALFHHGLVSQIPEVVYSVTTAKTRRYQTPIGTFSIHHLEPEFFFGFEVNSSHDVKMATPEKALIDVLYLSPTRSLIFQSLPEIVLSKGFRLGRAREIISKIQSESRRTIVKRKFETIVKGQDR